jgi:hypothetical protein
MSARPGNPCRIRAASVVQVVAEWCRYADVVREVTEISALSPPAGGEPRGSGPGRGVAPTRLLRGSSTRVPQRSIAGGIADQDDLVDPSHPSIIARECKKWV